MKLISYNRVLVFVYKGFGLKKKIYQDFLPNYLLVLHFPDKELCTCLVSVIQWQVL